MLHKCVRFKMFPAVSFITRLAFHISVIIILLKTFLLEIAKLYLGKSLIELFFNNLLTSRRCMVFFYRPTLKYYVL